MKKNIITIANVLADSNDIVADIVKYSEAKGALAVLRDSIKARLQDLASNAGVTLADAAKPLRAALVAEGMDKRRVSEVLLDLGIRERVAVKNEKRAAQSSQLDKEAEKLAQAIRKGHKLDEAIAIARRAYILLRDSK